MGKCAYCGSEDIARNVRCINTRPTYAYGVKQEMQFSPAPAPSPLTDICNSCGTLRVYLAEAEAGWQPKG
jgi:hypothetical protein